MSIGRIEVGWADMGVRERLFAIEMSLVERIERVDAMQRCRYDAHADKLAFRVGSGSTLWKSVRNVNVEMLAGKLGMTRNELRDWMLYQAAVDAITPAVEAVAPGDVAKTIAEADALWDALDEC